MIHITAAFALREIEGGFAAGAASWRLCAFA
jgi:hypothetical protein